MTTHTLQRVGVPIARAGVILLAIGVVVLGSSIISLFFGAHPYWWVWVFGVVALLGWAFTGDAGMALYVVKRLLWAVLVVNVVVFVTFVVFFKLPNGDPALRFVGNFITGDANGWPGLGYSYGNYVSVRSEIIQRAPRTLFLIAGAAIIWLF